MAQPIREQLKVIAERAVLVGVQLPGSFVDEHDPLGELRALARTAGARVVGEMVQKREQPSGRTYLGKGKVEELAALVQSTDATLVIFDNDLSPSQIRNVEEATRCKVIDRSELILDIFANRAATHAARLQVEIAQLEYTYPRLRAMWDHLGQIVGGAPVGIGTRGPGEKQLEIDRRLVSRRLARLKRELAEVQARKTREVAQRNADHITVGLVGYTNAGKSTLFNALTERGGAYAHDKLFATLSTRVESWKLPRGNEVLLSDTVGFIRNLPHHLVASFRSTLEETIVSQLLIIVVDVSDSHAHMQLDTVARTLDDIGASVQPRLIVLNKVDLVPTPEILEQWRERVPEAIMMSAATGAGLEQLADRVLDIVLGEVKVVMVTAPLSEPRAIDFLEKRTEVLGRAYDNGTVTLNVRLGRRHCEQLLMMGANIRIDDQPAKDAVGALWPNDDPARTPPLVPPHERLHP